MIKRYFMFCLLFISMVMTGCQMFKDGDARKQLFALGVIKYTTFKHIQESDHPGRQAQRIVEVASYAKDLVTAEEAASVYELEMSIREKINWDNLDEPDAFFVDAFLAVVRMELMAWVEEGALSLEDKLIVTKVLDTIASTAQMTLSESDPAIPPSPVSVGVAPRLEPEPDCHSAAFGTHKPVMGKGTFGDIKLLTGGKTAGFAACEDFFSGPFFLSQAGDFHVKISV